MNPASMDYQLKMKKTKIFGGILIAISALIFAVNANITGGVIGTSLSNSLSFVALIFLVIGGFLIMQEGGLEKKTKKIIREIDQDLRSGRIGNYRELEHYAIRLGLEIKEGGNHKSIYNGNNFITQIPRHARGVATRTYRSILKKLHEYAHSLAPA